MTKEIAIINYLATKVNDLFQTKLYKLLFYIDFYYYKNNEQSLTWAVYYKLPYWPVPLSIKTKIDFMIGYHESEQSNKDLDQDLLLYKKHLDIEREWYNFWKYKIVKKDALDVNKYLSKKELDVVDYVINKLWQYNVTKIVKFSHKEKAYEETKMFQPIFYGLSNSLNI